MYKTVTYNVTEVCVQQHPGRNIASGDIYTGTKIKSWNILVGSPLCKYFRNFELLRKQRTRASSREQLDLTQNEDLS
jgi:hypothetical protein